MYWIVRADKFLVASTEKVLEFVLEWFSVSQRNLETVCIILYMILGGIAFSMSHNYMTLVADGWLSLVMTVRSSFSPPIIRSIFRSWELVSVARVSIISWLIFCVVVETQHRYRLIYAIGFSMFIGFEYIYVAVNTGQRGRKRKMALAKLKELFSWLPEPLPEGV